SRSRSSGRSSHAWSCSSSRPAAPQREQGGEAGEKRGRGGGFGHGGEIVEGHVVAAAQGAAGLGAGPIGEVSDLGGVAVAKINRAALRGAGETRAEDAGIGP